MKSNLIKPDDKLLFSKVLNQVYLCQKRRERTFTDFLDSARATQFLDMLLKESDVNAFASGGFDEAERKIIGFSPDNTEIETSEFPIKILEMVYNTKFSKELTHRNYLGSILGLGIERSKIGDILLNENKALVFVYDNISAYILTNLEKVGNTKVSVSIKQGTEISLANKEEKLANIIVSSMRLDSVISAAFHISRGKSADLIKAEKVFINWSPVTSASKNVSIGDTITLRGHGRIKINEIVSKTKKDRLVINITAT